MRSQTGVRVSINLLLVREKVNIKLLLIYASVLYLMTSVTDYNSIQFFIIYVPSQQLQGQLQTQHSVIIIIISYGPDRRGIRFRVPVEARIFSSPRRPGRFWGTPCLLSNGYQRQSDRGVKLPIHLQLVPRSRICGSMYSLLHKSSWLSAYLVKLRDTFIMIPYSD
jgi:hypothetical protein